MAEAGCTPHQIMAVLGHTTHQQAATYTAKADRAGLASNALAAVYGGEIAPPAKERETKAENSAIKTASAKPRWQALGESSS